MTHSGEVKEVPAIELRPIMSGELFQKLIQYPVIVESWDRCKCGRGKRQWEKEFDEEERKQLEAWHKLFRQWHLQSGTPQRIHVKIGSIPLLQRACDFFAAI